MKGEEKSKKLMNTHWAKTLVMADGDGGDSEPLWRDIICRAASTHDLCIVSEQSEEENKVAF